MQVPWNRGGIRSYLLGASLVAGGTTYASVRYGASLVLVGVALHVWSKGCLSRNTEVTMCGPYRFVRHPFYLANALIDAGIVAMSGWWPLVAVFPFWWWAIYIRTMRAEEAYLAGRFGNTYETYRRRVPLFFPIRWPLPKTRHRPAWRLENLIREGELPRAIRLLSYPLPFLVLAGIHAHGPASAAGPAALLAASAWAVLYGTAGALKHHLRTRPGNALTAERDEHTGQGVTAERDEYAGKAAAA